MILYVEKWWIFVRYINQILLGSESGDFDDNFIGVIDKYRERIY